jgi:hypothetical protein
MVRERSLRLFEACSCKPASEGLPPSLVQHRAQFLTILRVPGTLSPAVLQAEGVHLNPYVVCSDLAIVSLIEKNQILSI